MINFQEVGRLLEGYMHTGQIPPVEGLSDEQNTVLNHIVQAVPHAVYARIEQDITFFLQEEYRLKGLSDSNSDDLKIQKEQRVKLRELLSNQKELRPLSGIKGDMTNETIASFLVSDFILLAQNSK